MKSRLPLSGMGAYLYRDLFRDDVWRVARYYWELLHENPQSSRLNPVLCRYWKHIFHDKAIYCLQNQIARVCALFYVLASVQLGKYKYNMHFRQKLIFLSIYETSDLLA